MLKDRDIPLLKNKHYQKESVFQAKNLLREARRQKDLSPQKTPEVVVLDPDGDLLSYCKKNSLAQVFSNWACYHTQMYQVQYNGYHFGLIGSAVGASFSVLLAEQLFASGTRFVLHLTSAGVINPVGTIPYFILINRSLRDEGTSYHYLAPSPYADIQPELLQKFLPLTQLKNQRVEVGATWTTDAPYRETTEAIKYAQEEGILAVEMEAAALYAFAQAKEKSILCLAQVTNNMAQSKGDFEKGVEDGAKEAMELIYEVLQLWKRAN